MGGGVSLPSAGRKKDEALRGRKKQPPGAVWGKKGRKRGKSLAQLGPKAGKGKGNQPTLPEHPELPSLDIVSRSAVHAATASFDTLDGDGGVGSCLDRELVRQGPENDKLPPELYFLSAEVRHENTFVGDGPFKSEELWRSIVLKERKACQHEDDLRSVRKSAAARGHEEIHLYETKNEFETDSDEDEIDKERTDIYREEATQEEWVSLVTSAPTAGETLDRRKQQEVKENVVLLPKTEAPKPPWAFDHEPRSTTPERRPRPEDAEGEEEEIEYQEQEHLEAPQGFELVIPQEEINRRAREAQVLAVQKYQEIGTPSTVTGSPLRTPLTGGLMLNPSASELMEEPPPVDRHIKAWREDFERCRVQRMELKAQGWTNAELVHHQGRYPRRQL
mmetsp:Transcript_5553/g.6389  ORF Transcript_5553/g.6389 Transcript_5553/m.6389 type:complete len:391 (+) Transcript_5553:20-1192(+)